MISCHLGYNEEMNLIECVPSENLEQHAQPRSLIRVFDWRIVNNPNARLAQSD